MRATLCLVSWLSVFHSGAAIPRQTTPSLRSDPSTTVSHWRQLFNPIHLCVRFAASHGLKLVRGRSRIIMYVKRSFSQGVVALNHQRIYQFYLPFKSDYLSMCFGSPSPVSRPKPARCHSPADSWQRSLQSSEGGSCRQIRRSHNSLLGGKCFTLFQCDPYHSPPDKRLDCSNPFT